MWIDYEKKEKEKRKKHEYDDDGAVMAHFLISIFYETCGIDICIIRTQRIHSECERDRVYYVRCGSSRHSYKMQVRLCIRFRSKYKNDLQFMTATRCNK